jgi:predicted AlkP superfamily pyrophosphatase or phosphodiesterase
MFSRNFDNIDIIDTLDIIEIQQNQTNNQNPKSMKSIVRRLLLATRYSLLATALASASAAAATPAQPLPGIKHVLIIGLDGFGAYAWEKTGIPNIKALAAGGSFAVARTVCDTKSAPNWGAHLSGAGPEFHGYVSNDAKPGIAPAVLSKYGRFPGIFGITRDAYPKAELGAVYEWDRIHQLIEDKALSYEKEIIQKTNAKDSPEQQVAKYEQGSVEVASTAVEYITTKKPFLAFVYFGVVDVAGHKLGHNTPGYYACLERIDVLVGKVLASLKTAGIEKDTLVLLISDHGGYGKKHGGTYRPEVIETPWIIAGPGVKRGYTIKAPVVHTDTAATIAHALGLTAPQCWRGRPALEVFESR